MACWISYCRSCPENSEKPFLKRCSFNYSVLLMMFSFSEQICGVPVLGCMECQSCSAGDAALNMQVLMGIHEFDISAA